MAVTTATTIDIATALEEILSSVDGMRAYRYVADNFRPPGAVIAMPSIDYEDPDAGFCSATWAFPISLIVSRNQDRASQDLLARLLSEVVQAIDGAEVEGVFSIDVLSAVPTSVTVAGQDLPSYSLRVRCRA